MVGSVLTHAEELTVNKCIELFAEAIPGISIQLLAIATTGKEVSTAAWLSLVASMLSGGFIAATITYDYDTNPENRAKLPEFNGLIPASARRRSIVFLTMMLFSGLLLIVRR